MRVCLLTKPELIEAGAYTYVVCSVGILTKGKNNCAATASCYTIKCNYNTVCGVVLGLWYCSRVLELIRLMHFTDLYL